MDLYFLIKDIKIVMLVVLVVLLVALAFYSFRQSQQLKTMKDQEEKIKEQLKHQVLLNGLELERPEMASNMSEESQSQAEEQDEWRDNRETNGEDGSESEEDHSAYIREIIKMQDSKLSPEKDYYLARQMDQVDSEDEEHIIFDNIEEISETDSEDAADKKYSGQDLKTKAESQLIKRIESDIKRSEENQTNLQDNLPENPKPLEEVAQDPSKVKPRLVLKPKSSPSGVKRPRGRPRKVLNV